MAAPPVPNLIRFRSQGWRKLPADFQLVPDLTVVGLPEVPPIPPVVNSGDLITAVHENTVREAISDLWIDVQSLANQIISNPVPATRQVIAGTGMTGGGPLTADVTLNANVTSVFGRSGNVVGQTGDYTAAMVTNAADRTQVYTDPVWIASLDYGKIANKPSVSSFQTPWLTDIDAANNDLLNVGKDVTHAGSDEWHFFSWVAQPIIFYTDAVERMRITGTGIQMSSAGDTVCEIKTTGSVQSTICRLVTQQGAGNDEWDIVASGAALAPAALRFVHGSAFASPLFEISDSAIRMYLGGSLRTLSVDGGGYVKAT